MISLREGYEEKIAHETSRMFDEITVGLEELLEAIKSGDYTQSEIVSLLDDLIRRVG